MSVTSGPPSRTPLAFYDPDTSSWRTSQGTFPWDSTPSLPTLPRWGTWDGTALYELPTPALPTPEPESSSLLPTPAVNDMGEGKTVEAWDEWTAKMRAKHANGNGHGPSLAIEAQRLLPTPVASDSNTPPTAIRSAERQLERGNTLPLSEVVNLLPTPMTTDAKGARNRTAGRSEGSRHHDGMTLTDAVTLLPTPTARLGDASSRAPDAARYKGPKSMGGRRSNLDDCIEAVRTNAPWLGGTTSQPSADGSESLDALPLDPQSLELDKDSA